MELLEDLVAANRILVQQGVLDGYGHVSVRDNRRPDRFLLSRSLAPEMVTSDDILEYDLEGNPIDARDRVSYLERFIHSAIYKARPDVQAVVHTHSPSVIPFGVSTVQMRPLYHMAAFLGAGIPNFDIRKYSGITNMLVNSPERARPLADVLGDHNAVLMRGHGAAVVGHNLVVTVGRSVYLELNARLQFQAIAIGGNITYLDPEETQQVLKTGENVGYERPWQIWKKKALQTL